MLPTPEQIEQIRAGLGLDRPIVAQFGIWLAKVMRADLGESFYFRIKVTELIRQHLETTLALAALRSDRHRRLGAAGRDRRVALRFKFRF